MFRFTIRDLLWLTAVVALGVGWSLDHLVTWHKVNDQRKAMMKVYVESRRAMYSAIESRDESRIRELEDENEALRRDIEQFKKELFGQK